MPKSKDPAPKPKRTKRLVVFKRKVDKAFGTEKTDPKKTWRKPK